MIETFAVLWGFGAIITQGLCYGIKIKWWKYDLAILLWPLLGMYLLISTIIMFVKAKLGKD